MAPSSDEKAQIINKWQKVDHQKKMKKTKNKKQNYKKKQEPPVVMRTPSKTHQYELAGSDNNHHHHMKKEEEENKEVENIDTPASGDGCSTPKAEKFKIPEILSCPPAPKKDRVFQNYTRSSIIRSPIAFFSSPDIDLFFSSLRNVS